MLIDRFTGRRPEELKRDEKALSEILKAVGANINGRTVVCPLCDDKKPSGSIYSNGNGFAYKCHKCGFNGSILDIITKVDGIEIAEVFKRFKGDTRTQHTPKVYPNIGIVDHTSL